MREKGILKKIDDIFNYCEEIDNHLPKEEQTGYRMLPDIFYIQKEVRNLQQKVEQLENMRKEAIKLIEEDILGKKIENVNWDYDECYYSDMPVERVKPLLNILNKGDNTGK